MTRPWADSLARSDPPLARDRTAAVAMSLALGLLSIAAADFFSRQGHTATYVFFWVGLLLIFIPISLVVLRQHADRRERLLYVVLLGVALYLVKVIGSPQAFAFTDEFIHLRNTQDILATGHLFEINPLLPTASYYPGLAAITAGFVEVSGLSPFASGILVIAAARVLFSASFFLVAERVTRSSRVAAAASLLYIANPMYLFWGAAFAYENLALPLAGFVVWWLGRTRREPNVMPQLAAVIVIFAVTVTHHIVGIALAALLGGWWLAERFIGLRHGSDPDGTTRAARSSLGVMTIAAATTSLAWLVLIARPAATYLLTNNIYPGLQQTVAVLLGNMPPRRLYDSGGFASAPWEVIAGWTAVVLLLLALLPALYLAWRRRGRAPMVVAMCVAAVYPLSLAPRLAPNGVAISGRLSEYVFAGLGCVVGLLVVDVAWWRRRRYEPVDTPATPGTRMTGVATAFLTVIFVGNVTIGTAFYQRLPEAQDPKGYPWSVQADVVNASIWAREHLGVNQRFGANAIDAMALATYGNQFPLAQNDMWPIFFADGMSESVVRQIQATGVRYLLVDWRMTRGVPPTPGYYFSPQEPRAGEYIATFPAAALQKFSATACAKTVYGSETLAIIDVSAIADGSCSPEASGVGSGAEVPG